MKTALFESGGEEIKIKMLSVLAAELLFMLVSRYSELRLKINKNNKNQRTKINHTMQKRTQEHRLNSIVLRLVIFFLYTFLLNDLSLGFIFCLFFYHSLECRQHRSSCGSQCKSLERHWIQSIIIFFLFFHTGSSCDCVN